MSCSTSPRALAGDHDQHCTPGVQPSSWAPISAGRPSPRAGCLHKLHVAYATAPACLLISNPHGVSTGSYMDFEIFNKWAINIPSVFYVQQCQCVSNAKPLSGLPDEPGPGLSSS